MIGFLRGRVMDAFREGHVLVDVNGVGYDVTIANTSKVPVGDEASFFIHTAVRPDAIVLYGFNSVEERGLFELLIETPGVGPSTALGAVRALPVDQMIEAIRSGDQKLIATIPGVGLKTASRVILELQGKLPKASSGSSTTDVKESVIVGLVSLGFPVKDITKSLAGVEFPSDEAEALKMALARMAAK
jgi:Holliday junction DNA helicase RuvA